MKKIIIIGATLLMATTAIVVANNGSGDPVCPDNCICMPADNCPNTENCICE